MIFLDTHVVVWLCGEKRKTIRKEVKDMMSEAHLAISPMVVLELAYMKELGRTDKTPEEYINAFTGDQSLMIDKTSFPEVIGWALRNTWTRDPFDRIIVAQAALHNAPLITKDRLIRKHYKKAVW